MLSQVNVMRVDWRFMIRRQWPGVYWNIKYLSDNHFKRRSLEISSVTKSFWYFALSTAVPLLYFMQNVKTIGQINYEKTFFISMWVKLIESEWRIYASPTWNSISSGSGLLPVRRQAIIWTNAEILLIRPFGTSVNRILLVIHTFSLRKIHLTMSSTKRRPVCLSLDVLS